MVQAVFLFQLPGNSNLWHLQVHSMRLICPGAADTYSQR